MIFICFREGKEVLLSWIRNPPLICRNEEDEGDGFFMEEARSRSCVFLARILRASDSKLGAMMTSMKLSEMDCAMGAEKVWLVAMIPPKAERGSDASASLRAWRVSECVQKPQGMVCLMMATVGFWKVCARLKAAFASM